MNLKDAKILEVDAGVRYWEDATINGFEDIDGTLVPFREDNRWKPKIDLDNGKVLNWPIGTIARIHYKVCDDGEYWLLDKDEKRIAKYKDYYVPSRFLCFGDDGCGDYIIFNIDENGSILHYIKPQIYDDEWEDIKVVKLKEIK